MPPTLRSAELDALADGVTRGESLVLVGSMGVGKTHLLGELNERLRRDGWICTEIRANPASATIPFGALAGFAAGGEGIDRLAMLQATLEKLASIGGGRQHVITIDDAPLLDEQSIAVFHHLLQSDRKIPLIATARSSDPESAALHGLWSALGAIRHAIEPLPAQSAEELVRQQSTTASDRDVSEIVRRSGGNPLFITELVRAHADDIDGGLTERLRDAVRARIDRLDDDSQHQLELVAVADPFDTDLDVADPSSLGRLERAGLISTAEDGEFVIARPAHPLYGEVVRSGLTALRRRQIARTLTAAMGSRSSSRRGDALRLAGWMRACGDEPSVELAVPAALEAISLLDVELANELVSIATAIEPEYPALFAAGEIARLTGEVDRALAWFERAFVVAETAEEIRPVALAIGQLHGFFRNDPSAAVRVLSEAADRLTDPAQRLELETERAMFGSMLGQYEDVLVSAGSILDHPDCGPEAMWTAFTNLTWAEAQLMNLDAIHDHLDDALALIPDVAPERAGEIDLVHAVKVNALMEQGRFDAALDASTTSAAQHEAGVPAGLTAFSASQVELLRGDASAARQLLDSAIEQLAAFDAFNAYPFVCGASAILAVVEGDTERARQDVSSSVERGGDTGMWDQIWLGRARAWMAMSSGRPDEALELLIAAGDVGISTSHRGWATFALHDALCWGAASDVVDRFVELRASMHDAALMELLADNVAAVAARDTVTAASHVRRFHEMGSTWHAAVASAAVAILLEEDGSDVEARRAATASRLWLPAATPAHPVVESIGLSNRRLDVVRSVLAGGTSRQIAEQMFLSVRTVDNHLGAAYAALEVNGRGDLAELFVPS